MVKPTKADWLAIISKAIEQAKAGDKDARAWLGTVVLKDAQLRRLAGLPGPNALMMTEAEIAEMMNAALDKG